jgi:Sybindin-like family
MYVPLNPCLRRQYQANRQARVVYALIIINKAGGLIYQRDFADGLNKLNINDYLVLAGTFHGSALLLPPLFLLPI